MSVRRNSTRGFSLIEMIVVLAVIAILAAIVVPSYQVSLRRARRAEGKAFLHVLMMAEERHYAGHSRYTADAGTGGLALPTASQPGGYYALSRLDLGTNAQSVTATVEPQGAQAADACGTLSLDSTGLFAASGGASDECG